MEKIKISFVLAILNADRTLEDCLNGILLQDYPSEHYEVIIVDGGSTDATLNIVGSYKKKIRNLKLIKNPNKLSEGRGMGKDLGIKKSKGEFIVLLDHDNLIYDKKWLEKMLYPFNDKNIMASQSMLEYKDSDPIFLKYINAIGVEDAFAIPYSLVSQATIYPTRFKLIHNKYYACKLDPKNVLFGGANGCIFRRRVFKIIRGYTRDVNVSASMAEHNMVFAIVKDAKLHHKTGSSFWKFFKKKIVYFNRFLTYGFKEENFKWVPSELSGKLRFGLRVFANLTLIMPSLFGLRQCLKTKKLFWLMHPFYLFSMTLAYGIITLLKIKNYFIYLRKK